MKIRRLITAAVIISAGVFSSFFGGPFSYAVFYASLCVPIVSLLYMLRVYFKLKVYQNLDVKTVTKGFGIKYYYKLSNEDIFIYKSVCALFMHDYSKVERTDDINGKTGVISLNPGESFKGEAVLTCLFRGEYSVGIESVIITDLLGLFSVKIKKPSEIKTLVYPRIINLSSLSSLNYNEDVKISPFSYSPENEIPDSEMKVYSHGDDIKLINWKVSAKYGELMVRKRTEIPKEAVLIILDVSPVPEYSGDRIITEDAMLETVLAVADFYRRGKTESEIAYYTNEEKHFIIRTDGDFNAFYNESSVLKFNGGMNAGDFLASKLAYQDRFSLVIVITSDIDARLINTFRYTSGIRSCVVLSGDRTEKEIINLRSKLIKTRLVHIPNNGDIKKILEKN